jgi:hypothetical protein
MNRTLLGLSLAAALIGAPPAYPLLCPDGAPACGNVGQSGRPRPAVAAPPVRPAPAVSAPPAAPRRTLLAPAVENRPKASARPRRDADGDPACGNVQRKGRC